MILLHEIIEFSLLGRDRRPRRTRPFRLLESQKHHAVRGQPTFEIPYPVYISAGADQPDQRPARRQNDPLPRPFDGQRQFPLFSDMFAQSCHALFGEGLAFILSAWLLRPTWTTLHLRIGALLPEQLERFVYTYTKIRRDCL